MEDYNIKEIKNSLKNEGFFLSANNLVKLKDDMAYIVFIHKTNWGYNIQTGICLNYKQKESLRYKDCVFGSVIGGSTQTNEVVNSILYWFEERNSIEKIKNLYNKKILSDFVCPEIKDYL